MAIFSCNIFTTVFFGIFLAGILSSCKNNNTVETGLNDKNLQHLNGLNEPGIAADGPMVGGLKGQFAVNSNGLATYAIPLPVPPGINGQTPKLGLQYTSTQSNGSLGIGWSLSGVSRITRCTPNLAIDNMLAPITYGGTDRFCLDGSRLIVVSGAYGAKGSKYRTEIESWRSITANSDDSCGTGPCSFTVVDKKGHTRTYGVSASSGRILALGKDDVRVWSISSSTDLNGNELTYTYSLDPLGAGAEGAYYIVGINYTSNSAAKIISNRSVVFNYSARSEAVSKYLGGVKIQQTALLSSINTYVNSTPVQNYRLAYNSNANNVSQLESVMVCPKSDSAVSSCLTPTRFSWSESPSAYVGESTGLANHFGSDNGWTAALGGRYLADVNGDGKADIVGFGATSTSTGEHQNPQGVYVALSAGNTFSTPTSWSTDYTAKGGWDSTTPRVLADVNADGMADIVGFEPAGVLVALSTGSAFISKPVFPHFGTNQGWYASTSPKMVTDVTGDGCADIVGMGSGIPPTSTPGVYVSVSNCLGSFAVPVLWTTKFASGAWTDQTPRSVVDVNGDGMADLLGFTDSGVEVLLSTGSSFTSTGWSSTAYNHFSSNKWFSTDLRTTADVNGDGLIDIVGIKDSSGVFVGLNTGNSFLAPVSWSSHFYDSLDLSQNPIQILDINADQMADIVEFGVSGVKVALSTGSAFSEAQWGQSSLPGFDSSSGNWSSQTPRQLADINGDGFIDVVGFGQNSVKVGLVSGSSPNVITSIDEGLGGEISSITYQTMSASVYSGTNTQQVRGIANAASAAMSIYPIASTAVTAGHQHVMRGGTKQLVASYIQSDGDIALAATDQYRHILAYSNAVMDVGGRGWLGFETKSITDFDSGDITVTSFNQQFPLTGTIAKVEKQCTQEMDEKCTTTGSVLHGVSTTYDSTVSGPVSPHSSVYVIQKSYIRNDYYEYDTHRFSIGSSYAYDDWGNQNLKSYLGYVSQVGADLSPIDNVYTLQKFYTPGSKGVGSLQLAYPQYHKVSKQSSPSTIATFAEGKDISLSRFTYFTGSTMNLETRSHWDDTNKTYLTYTYSYDDFGNKTSITDPASNVTTLTYEAIYNTYKASKTTPENSNGTALVTHYGYDPRYGKLTATTGPNNNTHGLCYDSFGRLIAKQVPIPVTPANVVPSTTCIAPSLITGSTSASTASLITVNQYEHALASTGFYCHVTQNLVDWPIKVASPTPVFSTSKLCVDGMGRHRQQSHIGSGGTSLETAEYNSKNLVTSKTAPHFTANTSPVSSTRTYDAYGRLLTSIIPSGSDGATDVTKTVSYSTTVNAGIKATLNTTITEASGSANPYAKTLSHNIVNGKSKLQKVVVPGDDTATSTFVHDLLGRRKSMTDPIGIVSSMTRDSLGRTATTTNPATGTISFAYSSTGVLQTKTDGHGATTYAFDDLGRMLSKTFFDKSEARFAYDDTAVANGLGRLTSNSTIDTSSATASSKTFGYDSHGKKASESLSLSGNSYTTSYVNFPDGNPRKITYPDASVQSRLRNSFGELTSLSVGSTTYVTYSDYDMSGRAKTVTYANDLVESRSYWPLGLQGSYSIMGNASTSLYDETYEWDKLGLMDTITDNLSFGGTDLSQSFDYTSMRLTGASASGTYGSSSYGYDTGGNLTSLNPDTAVSAEKVTYTYETAPSQQIKAGTNTAGTVFKAAYDALGNTKAMSEGSISGSLTAWAFTYDPQNRMTLASNGSISTSYGYDANAKPLWKVGADGRKTIYVNSHYSTTNLAGTSSQTIKHISDAHKRAASITSTTDLSSEEPIEAASAPVVSELFFHRNYHGSIIATSAGTLAATVLASRVVYDPLGAVYSLTGADNYDQKYSGLALDNNTKLYNHTTRFLNAGLGRFMSADTGLGGDWARQDAHNRYAYGFNAASTYADMGGLAGCRVTGSVAGGVTAIIGGVTTGAATSYDLLDSLGTTGAVFTGIGAGLAGGFGEGLGAGAGVYVVCEAIKKAGRRAAARTAQAADQALPNNQRPMLQEAPRVDTEEEMRPTFRRPSQPEEALTAEEKEILDCLCFTGKTLVATSKGKKEIASIGKGASVWSYNFDTVEASLQNVVEQNVTAKPVTELIRISVNGSIIEATVEHPFWEVQKSQWVAAEKLMAGDQLLSKDKTVLSIDSVERVQGDFEVYNFEVEKNNNYYVSESEVLVHNLSCQGERTGLGEVTEMGSSDASASSEAAADAEMGAATSAVDATGDVAVTGATATAGVTGAATTTTEVIGAAVAAPAAESAAATAVEALEILAF